MPRTSSALFNAVACCFILVATAHAADPSQSLNQNLYFESHVRPVLIERCIGCHGEKKQKGGLRLDSLAAALRGGKHGQAIAPRKPEGSLLIKAISRTDADLKMPPDEPLPVEEQDALRRWIELGAPWAESASPDGMPKPSGGKHRRITDEDRTHWSFQPMADSVPPREEGDRWSKNAVDRFIFARLKSEGLTPADEADKITLIRRATFDLHGLPPTPEEVDAFVHDASPTAYESLIDRLLASPRYGERWGRHWLDLVRYAESDGYKQDAYRPNAWPYRDYVVRSFNDDKPYDRFVMEQLAGDEIAPDDPSVFVATGYLRHGIYEYNQADVRRQWTDILNEVTDVTSDVFLGLSMGCARCHDHKFDPILQSDYYKLQAFFTPMVQRHDLPLATPTETSAYRAAQLAWEAKTADLRAQIADIERPFFDKQAEDAIGKFPLDIRALIHKPAAERTLYEEQLVRLANRQVAEKTEKLDVKLKGEAKEKYADLKRRLAELEKDKPAPPMMAFVATDIGSASPPTAIAGAGGATVEPGYLTVLEKSPLTTPSILPTTSSTGRRTALAKWLTQPNHPLTARVAVNRIWQYHFGRGLVATSSDFGRLGEKPSHPELLDYLARRFVEGGWSFKRMHRLIMMSAAYRQSALRPMPAAARLKDPENRWLWRMNTQRLEGEQIRDAMLAVSGELKLDVGGPSADPTGPRRSVYTKQLRNARDPLLDAFDLPDAFGSMPVRNVTTTATQSLLMMNGQWPMARARAFAARVQADQSADVERTVEAAYRLAYGRSPNAEERAAAIEFLTRSTSDAAGQARIKFRFDRFLPHFAQFQ